MKTVCLIVVMLSVLLPLATIAEAQQPLSGAVVERFCSADGAGKKLNEPGAKEIARELLLTENTWNEPTELIIIKDYSVRASASKGDTAQIAVDYNVLGHMDSSLSLTRVQMPYSNQPVSQSEHFSLLLTDTHSEVGPDGRLQQIKGTPEWRIKAYPSQPHISIDAAMAYVRMMGHHARDMRVKMNAQKTLSELQNMLAPSAVPPQSAGPEPILSQFIEMQMGGLALQSETAAQLNMLLVHPPTQNQDKVDVARAYAVKKTTLAGNKATVSVEYGASGELNSQLRFTSMGDRGTVVQRDYKLLLDNKYTAPAYGDKPASEFIGPSRWRIEEAPPAQWVSVATAIRYVTQVRDTTKDAVIRDNAAKTLAILGRYR
jgi:hypothetical protein